MSWKLPWDGGCRCGRLRFRVTADPLLSAACHCAGCQKMTASAFSLSILDDHAWFQPYVDMNAAEKLPWAVTGAPRSYAKQPEMSELGALCAEFAERGARP